MFLETLRLENFRNYSSLDLILNPSINIFYGNNAQGKTNILEAIYVLGLSKSHRGVNDIDLLKYDETHYGIKGILNKDNIKTDLKIIYQNKIKNYQVDMNIIKKVSDYISIMNIILFCPDDIELIKDGPEIRRKYLNDEISQIYKLYYKILQDFNKILRLRNDMLYKMNKNEIVDMNYFNILTDYFIEKSLFIYQTRNKYLKKISDSANKIYIKIMKEKEFLLNYKLNFETDIDNKEKLKKDLTQIIKENLNEEIKNSSTLYGPHRDDFEFISNGKNLKLYGSQGQQKMSILVLKLAEIDIFYKQTNHYPILLLDDIFSEFDEVRRNNIIKYINGKVQTILTTTDLDIFKTLNMKTYNIYKVNQGKITKKIEV